LGNHAAACYTAGVRWLFNAAAFLLVAVLLTEYFLSWDVFQVPHLQRIRRKASALTSAFGGVLFAAAAVVGPFLTVLDDEGEAVQAVGGVTAGFCAVLALFGFVNAYRSWFAAGAPRRRR
jgi:hypothetical protein